MTTYTDFTDTELERYIQQYEASLEEMKRERDRRTREQEVSSLEAYWQANPQFTPLAVGDKLLVPEGDYPFNSGEIVEVIRIRPNLVVHLENNSGDAYPYEYADIQEWRVRYLAAQPETSD